MTPIHTIKDVHFQDDFFMLTIDGQEKKFVVKEISPALAQASDEERSALEISPPGYGIHWPLIDEDLSINCLLGIIHKPDML
jgi:hypothetical protein